MAPRRKQWHGEVLRELESTTSVASVAVASACMNGYLVWVDCTRYVAQAERAAAAEDRVRSTLGIGAQRVSATRALTDDEIAVLQLAPGEVRAYPEEHG